MDPNAALRELRELVARIQTAQDKYPVSLYQGVNEEDVSRLAELFDGLDGWLSKSGALPDAWVRK